MPVYTECLLSICSAYLAWLAATGQPWTWETYAIRSSLITQAYTYAIVWGQA